MEDIALNPTIEAIEEARRSPDGVVYAIEGVFGPDEHVPPEAIIGLWVVDANGLISGDFVANPNYRGKRTQVQFRSGPSRN